MQTVYEFYLYRGRLKRISHTQPAPWMTIEANSNQQVTSLNSRVYSFDCSGVQAAEMFAQSLEKRARKLEEKADELQKFIAFPSFKTVDAVNLGSYRQAKRKETLSL